MTAGHFTAWIRTARMERHGTYRHSITARYGTEQHGSAWIGTAPRRTTRRGMARIGFDPCSADPALHGWIGTARHGT